MTPLAKAMEVVFIVAWCVGVAAWFYSARYFIPMWRVGFDRREEHRGYVRKALMGAGVFIVAFVVGFAAGGIAELWGGGWQ